MQEAAGMAAGSDLVAVWEVGGPSWVLGPYLTHLQVHLADGIHVIEFEHGTTSGSRVLRVDREVRM